MTIRYNGITINRERRTIAHRGQFAVFAGARSEASKPIPEREESRRFKIACQLILGSGASMQQIFWHLYADDPDGGPLEGPHLIHIVMCQMKPVFDKLDLTMRSVKIAGVSYYELVPVFHVAWIGQAFKGKDDVAKR